MGKKQPEIDFTGEKITLPVIAGKPMDVSTAITFLREYEENQSAVIEPLHELDVDPLEGLIAFHRALSEKFGWTKLVPSPGFFGSSPPKMIGIPISATETVQVPLGQMKVPGLSGTLKVSFKVHPNPLLVIGAQIYRKDEALVNELVALTRKHIESGSIYKGKAVKINFDWVPLVASNIRGYEPLQDAPKFMELDASVERNLIFSDEVRNALDVGLFTPIEQTEACRAAKIPLKRGILLFGRYGTGKTLTANITALKAVRNGWTFIYLKSVTDLKPALDFAKRYAPAVLFAEDIDRVMTGERSDQMDMILNTLDGIDTKGAEIVTVFSTNHIERINPAVLRMGRLDSLIEVTPPDASAAVELVKLYGRQMLDQNCDLTPVGAALAGKIPAFIREVVERAKLAMISRTKAGECIGTVSTDDLLNAARTMEVHDRLIFARKEKQKLPELALVKFPQGTLPEEYTDVFIEGIDSADEAQLEQ